MLALLLTLAPLAPQEVLTETLPDGRVVEREVVRDADGRAVDHGSYKVRHANGEEAIRGRMKDGLRHGKWRFFYPSGEKQATGWYLTGLRDKKWTYWHEDGEVDEEESGLYEIREVPLDRERLRSRGETKGGQRHGAWEFFWASGATKARGSYARGSLEGSWQFFHADGVFDPDWMSGIYRGGRWASALPEADRAPRPPAPPREDAVAEVDPAAEERLREGFDGLPMATAADDDPLLARRWSSLVLLTAGDPGFALFTLDEQRTAAGEGATLADLRPALSDGSDEALLGRFGSHVLACRLAGSPQRLLFAEEDEKTLAAIESGLDWLVRHQRDDGSWHPEKFTERCAERGEEACEGPGMSNHVAGMTGLALLALVGHGNTPHHGPHAEAVARATRWLVEQQEEKTGLLAEVQSHSYLYNHAIATMALCEAAAFTDSVVVRDAAQAAVRVCLAARNEGSAWRYDYPPSGDNDTSMTAWMVQALRSAEAAGLEVDSLAFLGAKAWIGNVTHAESGRIGYDTPGSKGARIEGVNDHFPPELAECMTAAGLYARILAGETPERNPLLLSNAALLLTKPPAWDPTFGGDFYYWYYGIHAMRQLDDEEHWEPWKKALVKALLARQVRRGEAAGSWSQASPWEYAGGRIYQTAMAVLCLEADYRHPVVLER